MGEGLHQFDRAEEVMSPQDVMLIRHHLRQMGIEASVVDVLAWDQIEAILNPAPSVSFDPKVMEAIEVAMGVEVPKESITELSPKRAEVLAHCEIDEAKRLENICAGRGGLFVAGC